MRRTFFSLSSIALCLLSLTSPAAAGGPEPGSLLIFPEYDNRAGEITFLTITNTDSTRSVKVHLNSINATNCLVFNRTITLTPRDTYTAITSALTGVGMRGYIHAYAQSMTTGHAIDFDKLIGSALRIDSIEGVDYSVPPFIFRGLTGDGTDTDVDHDAKTDLNGIEYEKSPNRVCFPRFFNQHNEPLIPNTYASDLILFQPLGGPGVTTLVGFLIYNDNEEVFSSQTEFVCWKRQRLLDITGAFSDWFLKSTSQAPSEVVGLPAMETGWFEVIGQIATGPANQSQSSPPILGLLIDLRPSAGADLPFLNRP